MVRDRKRGDDRPALQRSFLGPILTGGDEVQMIRHFLRCNKARRQCDGEILYPYGRITSPPPGANPRAVGCVRRKLGSHLLAWPNPGGFNSRRGELCEKSH